MVSGLDGELKAIGDSLSGTLLGGKLSFSSCVAEMQHGMFGLGS